MTWLQLPPLRSDLLQTFNENVKDLGGLGLEESYSTTPYHTLLFQEPVGLLSLGALLYLIRGLNRYKMIQASPASNCI